MPTRFTFKPNRPLFNVNVRARTQQEVDLADLNVLQERIELATLQREEQRNQEWEKQASEIMADTTKTTDRKGMDLVALQKSIFPDQAIEAQSKRRAQYNKLVTGTDITTPEMQQAIDKFGERAVGEGSEQAWKEIAKAVKQNNMRYGIVGKRGVTEAQMRASAANRVGRVIEYAREKHGVIIDSQSMTHTDRQNIHNYAKGAGIKNIGQDLIFLGSKGDLGISKLEEANIDLRGVQADRPDRERYEGYINDAQFNKEKVLEEYKQRIERFDVPGSQWLQSRESDIKDFFEGEGRAVNEMQRNNPELYATLMEMYLIITGQYEQYAESRLNREKSVRVGDIKTQTKPKL